MLNIVIPMAGRGSRFANEGYIDPKPLIDLNGKKMIEVVINNLRPSIKHRFIFICQNEHIKAYGLNDRLKEWCPGSKVIGIDGVTEGAACTVLLAKQLIDTEEPLMIANSDQWVDASIDDYLAKMQSNAYDGMIMTMTANDPKWSFVEFDEFNHVSNVVEKVVVSDEATVGIYNFKRGSDFVKYAELMIERNERSNGEFYVAPVYTYLYKEENYKIGVYNIGEEANGMYGLGIPSDLNLFLTKEISKKALKF
ncbi:glycosyltransferase family 2 protein [Vibrio parahaemolyticus]|nr:glycosyltransferase family 2 protein [Vibrio parahaemolyticus]